MNPKPLLAAALLSAAACSVAAQIPPLPTPALPPTADPAARNQSDELVFDLDFTGGTPAGLVAAIQRAWGTAPNVIIPSELAATELPPLKLRQVTLPDLFAALELANRRQVSHVTTGSDDGRKYWQTSQETAGFRTADRPPRFDSIWYFYVDKSNPNPNQLPSVLPVSNEEVRVLNLSPYLRGALTVDDITTAIRVACEMLPDGGQPKLTFHKETNLLLTRGRPDQLELVERVLSQLDTSAADHAANPYLGIPHRPQPAPGAGANATPNLPMSEELMRRYGLPPATKAASPKPEPAAAETPRP